MPQIWPWPLIETHGSALLNAALVTVVLAVATIATGNLVGVLIGVLARGRSPWLRPLAWLLRVGVRAVRVVPVLVVILLLLHASPAGAAPISERLDLLAGQWMADAGHAEAAVLGAVMTPAFLVAFLALAAHLAACVADIIRREVDKVSSNLVDAARAQGMGPWRRLRRVIVPEAFRASLPAILSLSLTTFMLTTLAAVIGCRELLHTAWTLAADTGEYTGLLSLVAVFFAAVLLPAHLLIRRVEHSAWIRRRV